jgi:HAE1 family hydrophobic/amphiphilic exporter-1
MNLPISSWAIRNPIPVIVVFTLLTIAGLFSYSRLPVKQYPNISFPLVQVIVVQDGAAASEMENQVTRLASSSSRPPCSSAFRLRRSSSPLVRICRR